MPRRTPQTERIGAFSDGVFAVIITIMVLQLKPPEHPTFAALALLWPTALSYAVSYFFIAIVWVNHHYLLRMAEGATPQLIREALAVAAGAKSPEQATQSIENSWSQNRI